MALRGTLTHWKTRLLASSLQMMPCQALGILEALWHVTAELAPEGNIGRLPNKAIAMEMFYEGDADELINALIESGHLDRNEEHRLIIHDWSQHADYNTKRKVTRRNGSIVKNDGSRLVMTRHESIPEPVPVPEPEPVPEPVKKNTRRTSSDSAQVSDIAPVVDRLFEVYCRTFGRNPRQYTLTDERRKKAILRLREREKLSDLKTAEDEARRCIANLAASDYHQSHGYVDWTDQIFRTQEEFQKRLTWKPPSKALVITPTAGPSLLDEVRAERASA